MNSAVRLTFKVRFTFFRICESREQCMRPNQKTQILASTQTHCYPN